MRLFKKSPSLPLVVIASRNPKAFEKFSVKEARVVEVVTSRGLVRALEEGPALVVADLDDVVPTADFSLESLKFVLLTAEGNGIPVVPSEMLGGGEYDAASLSQAKTSSGVRYLLPKVIIVTNYAGGIGKSTLSLSMARAFRKYSGLGAAVIEAGVGASALAPKLNIASAPSLYEVILQNAAPKKWEGVDLYPLSMREAQVLAGEQRTSDAIRSIAQAHTLTVFDASPLTPLWSQILNLADEILVITTPRGDTIAQADVTYREIADFLAAQDSKLKPTLVMNMVTSLGDRLSLGNDLGAWVPFNDQAARSFSENLSLPVLNMLYSGFDRLAGKNAQSGKKTGKRAGAEPQSSDKSSSVEPESR